MTDKEKEAADFLDERYAEAMSNASGRDNPKTMVDKRQAEDAAVIVGCAEASKAALAVSLTCLTYKIFFPEQDIRRHQRSIEGGFSGRTFDSLIITPFLRRHNFPCMAESGWLTARLNTRSRTPPATTAP